MNFSISRNLCDKNFDNKLDRFLSHKYNKIEYSIGKIKSYKKNNNKKFIQKNLSFNENILEIENERKYDLLIENSISKNFCNSNLELVKKYDDENKNISFNKQKYSKYRKINENVYKVLDAPGIIDDYYSSILDWNENNYIIINLKFGIYLWCPQTCKADKILKNDLKKYIISDDYSHITSLKSSNYNDTVVIGYSNGNINYLNYCKKDIEYTNKLGCSRIATLDIMGNLICFGNKEGKYFIKDFRDNKNIKITNVHSQEICKIKFSEDLNYIASGGNDNSFNIFDIRKMNILYKVNNHKSGVRAISWNNRNKNIIASGGGTNDKTIKIWDLRNNLELLNSIDTGSQVCNLIYSKNTNELISSHGYSDNNICIWNNHNNDLEKIAILKGSNERVLHLSISPCGENIVSGSGDETLRFYNPFPKNEEKNLVLEEKFKTLLR